MASKNPAAKPSRASAKTTPKVVARPVARAPSGDRAASRRAAAAPARARTEQPAAATVAAAPATKQALLIALLRSVAGATLSQMAQATGWQHHTIRGTISGVLRKKLKLTVVAEKAEGGAVYRIVEAAAAA